MTEPTLTAVPAAGHETLAEARRLATSSAVELVCTDVFDTLVWRKVAEPVHAFEEVGRRLEQAGRLHPTLDPPAFGNLRRIAEKDLRARVKFHSGHTEIGLDEIYGELPRWVFADGTPDDAIAVELETERDLLLGDLDVVELLVAAAEAGKPVAAVSDTYLSEEQLRELVAFTRVPFRWVFTSSDHRENKSGGLWDIVLAATGAAPAQVLHVGDNEVGDFELPAERGIRVVHLERRSQRLDRLMDGEEGFRHKPARLTARGGGPRPRVDGDGGLAALRAKMEHRAELAGIATAQQPFWRFGAQVYGPVFTGFAEWVHERTRAAGASRALCLMREGGFLAELVNAAGAAVEDPVEARPLWLNRDLCTRAAIGAGTREELEPLFFRRTPPTLRELLRGLGLQPNDLLELAAHADTRMDDPIMRELVLEALMADGPVRERVAEHARDLRERLVRYVEREAGADGPIVLVDLGWGATIQRRLARALEHAARPREITGLYVLTTEAAALTVMGGTAVEGYLANVGEPEGVVETIMRGPEVLEQALMPAHGTQIGLTEELEPVLAESPASSLQDVEAEALRRGIRAFQAEYLRYEAAHPGRLRPLSAARERLAPLLMRAAAAPTEEEAAMFGRWIHDENQGSARASALIDGDWGARVRHLAPEQLQELPMEVLYWPYGVARRHDSQLGELAAAAAAGLISWEATATPLETGRLTIAPVDGIGIDGSPTYDEVPRRNRHGLSFATVGLEGGMIRRLDIRLGERPVLARIDWLVLRLWAQGEAEPIEVRMASPGDFARLDRMNVIEVGPSLFLATNDRPILGFDVAPVTPKVVFRIDVELAFAALAVSPTLPATAPDLSRLVARDAARELSGRLPGPLRRLLARLRR